MSASGLAWLAGATAAFLAAASGLRLYVGTERTAYLAGALALYVLGNLMMVRIMRDAGMAVAISISGVAQLVMANAVAIALFGERPGRLQAVGIALGIAAVVLIALPGQGRR